MFHKLVFRVNVVVDVQVPGKARLERLMLKQGDEIEAQVRCFVKETKRGPVEMADLQLSSGETLRGLRMAYFEFV